MKYVQPYGVADPDASYINGDPSVGRMGSIPPAEAFEHPMRELVGVINSNQITPDEDDLLQVAKGVRSQRSNFVIDTGSANALSVALDPPLLSYSIGLPLRVKVANTNTTGATINAGAGTVAIKRPTGAALMAGDLVANGLIELVYDGTAFQMINFGGVSGVGDTETFEVNVPYCVDSAGSGSPGYPNRIIAVFSPALTELVAGTLIMVKVSNSNNSFLTIDLGGTFGVKTVKAQGCTPAYATLPNDVKAGDVLIFAYDGTVFWIYANDSIDQSVGFTVTNNAQFTELFNALARKRILGTGYVNVVLASGIYNPIATNHPNANSICVQGTMLAARPTFADFQKTGSSPAARANDAVNNINMLRSRYGVEIRQPNILNGAGIYHAGGGKITFMNLLVTGDNVSAGARGSLLSGVMPDSGSAIQCTGVSVWGIGGLAGFFTGTGTITCTECYSVANQNGYYAVVGGTINLWQCASYGNASMGVMADRKASIAHFAYIGVPGASDVQPSQHVCNGYAGVYAATMSQISLDRTNVTSSGAIDIIANIVSVVGLGATGPAVYGSTSPVVNTEGNSSSIIAIGVF